MGGCVNIPTRLAWALLLLMAGARPGVGFARRIRRARKMTRHRSRQPARSPLSNRVLSGRITVDGSSTVYPITQAAAEEFMKLQRKVAIPIGVAGTAGGFKRFVVDDLDVCDASRPIEPEEIEMCRKIGVDYLELPIANGRHLGRRERQRIPGATH